MPNRMYVPTDGPDDWRRFLAEPDKQWRAGYSAHALACAWERADGLPDRVRQVFEASGEPHLEDLEIVVGLPEHRTPLPGGSRPSQTDLLVVAKNHEDGLKCIGVEGKAEESFGPLISEWLADGSPGKANRLAYLCSLLGLDPKVTEGLRYQLLHRTGATLLEAGRFRATYALMLVHSFSPHGSWFEDYAAFATALGVDAQRDGITLVGERRGIKLALGWVSDTAASE